MAKVDLSTQRMTVSVDGVTRYVWAVSTARRGYVTPVGSFRAQRMERIWYSSKYDNAPMPNSVFFLGGYAIHGTNAVWSLGRPASHGCIRLAPGNAALFYSLVRAHGMGASRIIVSY
ncbi:MAG TPA: L,D-transpeptidase [Bauldia sp.]|nr:L,D-transpeptidase [Bauldia sp.]